MRPAERFSVEGAMRGRNRIAVLAAVTTPCPIGVSAQNPDRGPEPDAGAARQHVRP